MISTSKRRRARPEPSQSVTRDIIAILRHPRTDQEQEIADAHIARECARIRATWSETEIACRALDCTRVEFEQRRLVIPTVAWLGEA